MSQNCVQCKVGRTVCCRYLVSGQIAAQRVGNVCEAKQPQETSGSRGKHCTNREFRTGFDHRNNPCKLFWFTSTQRNSSKHHPIHVLSPLLSALVWRRSRTSNTFGRHQTPSVRYTNHLNRNVIHPEVICPTYPEGVRVVMLTLNAFLQVHNSVLPSLRGA